MKVVDLFENEFENVPFKKKKEQIAHVARMMQALDKHNEIIWGELKTLGMDMLGVFGTHKVSATEANEKGLEIITMGGKYDAHVLCVILKPENAAAIKRLVAKHDRNTERYHVLFQTFQRGHRLSHHVWTKMAK